MTRQLVGKLRLSGGEVSMSVGQVPVGGWEVDGCGYELLSRTVKKLQMVFVALPSSIQYLDVGLFKIIVPWNN